MKTPIAVLVLILYQALAFSQGTEKIKVFFNHSVDNSASGIADAVYNPAFEDTIIGRINTADSTLDVCIYNTGSLPIVNAVNAAADRGVTVRYVGAANGPTNNDEIANLTVPLIQRPDDGEEMHNKFILIDAGNSAKATVITGSANHTDNSLHNDYNNLLIIQDQPLAAAYTIEFEEMWGSTGPAPNPSLAKFGPAKTDNTPHLFTIDGISVELYFSPSDGSSAHIRDAILTANSDMEFGMLTFIRNEIGDAVKTVNAAGADVKGIIENVSYFGSEYSGLLADGIPVISHFSEPWFFHHKYGIVDATNSSSNPLVITGSQNWTNSGEEDYDENTLIIHDAAIAGMFYEEFSQRYAELSTSIWESREFEIQIFPNPSNGRFNLRGIQIDISELKLWDFCGKQVEISIHQLDPNEFEISVQENLKGMFFMTIQKSDGILQSEKIILE